MKRFSLGAHAPALSAQDIEQIHLMWVEAVKEVGPQVHHRDVVAAALGSLKDELAGDRHDACSREASSAGAVMKSEAARVAAALLGLAAITWLYTLVAARHEHDDGRADRFCSSCS